MPTRPLITLLLGLAACQRPPPPPVPLPAAAGSAPGAPAGEPDAGADGGETDAGADAGADAAAAVPAGDGRSYLKGQTHLHSKNSKDSRTPPRDVARWYAEHAYDFIVFTDHNRVTDLGRVGDLLTFRGVELSQNTRTCVPAPKKIKGRKQRCIVHTNALFVAPREEPIAFEPGEGLSRLALFEREVKLTAAMGGLVQLNHPNFHYAADAKLIADLVRRGVKLLEVANEAVDSNNEGDEAHPSTEALWDAVLSEGLTVWGVASDDAHHYDDADAVAASKKMVHVGERGWVMVRARREEGDIRRAFEEGDFYSSTGVTLRRIEARDGALVVEVDGPRAAETSVVFIGDGGKRVGEAKGPVASQPLPEKGYVRAVASLDGRKAWTQPARRPARSPGDARGVLP